MFQLILPMIAEVVESISLFSFDVFDCLSATVFGGIVVADMVVGCSVARDSDIFVISGWDGQHERLKLLVIPPDKQPSLLIFYSPFSVCIYGSFNSR